MKRIVMAIAAVLTNIAVNAVDNNTVTIAYNGTSATVNIASNVRSYVTYTTNGAHVTVKQTNTADVDGDEITYILSGSSTDGEFMLDGSYKCTIEVQGLTLSNPSGPAINIQNGKRIKLSAKNGTTSTLSDGFNEDYNGCIHCKGHLEFKGKGTLNVTGNSKHAVYSKEYVEFKNCTLNVTSAVKDGIHCKEYFFMESGTVSIGGVGDDGIQVELSGKTSTGVTPSHEDEDTGNFYQEGGVINITLSNSSTGKYVNADGDISYAGGTQNYTTGISTIQTDDATGTTAIYDLNGRQLSYGTQLPKGIYIIRKKNRILKTIVK